MLIETQTPEDQMIVHQQLDCILDQLSTDDKAVILAKKYYGYSYQEISVILDISVSALKSKVFRIRKQAIKSR